MNIASIGRRAVAVSVTLSFLTVTSACYGPFNLTRNVYHWNSGIKGSGEVNDKWMKEFVFFGMIVIPVYMFSALLDAFVFNAIQFWSGNNPIKVTGGENDGEPRVARLGDLTVRWTVTSSGADVWYERGGAVVRRASIVRNGSGYRLLDDGGVVLAEAVSDTDGVMTLLDGECRLVATWSGDRWQTGSSVVRAAAEPAS